MIEFVVGEPIRLLPCMHFYHLRCIDDWLMRSFTCPTCMQPVDIALRNTAAASRVLLANYLFMISLRQTAIIIDAISAGTHLMSP